MGRESLQNLVAAPGRSLMHGVHPQLVRRILIPVANDRHIRGKLPSRHPPMDLKFFLEDLLGRPVDLVTSKALKAALRARIASELVDVA